MATAPVDSTLVDALIAAEGKSTEALRKQARTAAWTAFKQRALTAAPAPAPTPAPTPASAGYVKGWELTRSMCGIAGAGLAITQLQNYSGSLASGSSTAWNEVRNAILTDPDVDGKSYIRFTNCVLRATGAGDEVAILYSGGPVDFVNSEIVTYPSTLTLPGNCAVRTYGGRTTTSTRSVFDGAGIGLWLDGGGTHTNAWVRSIAGTLPDGSPNHSDGFTRRSGTDPLSLLGCHIDADNGNATGGFFLQSTQGGAIDNVTLQDSWLAGGVYCVRVEASVTGSNIRIVNNRIKAASVANAKLIERPVTWQNNFLDDPAKPDHVGAAV